MVVTLQHQSNIKAWNRKAVLPQRSLRCGGAPNRHSPLHRGRHKNLQSYDHKRQPAPTDGSRNRSFPQDALRRFRLFFTPCQTARPIVVEEADVPLRHYIGRDPFSPLCAPHPPCAGRSADVPVSLYARICSAHPSAPLVCRGAAAMPWRQVKATWISEIIDEAAP